MPKPKTRKSVLKRFRVTKSGKVLARHAFRRHLKASKSKKTLGNLKKIKVVGGFYAKKIKKYLGYKKTAKYIVKKTKVTK